MDAQQGNTPVLYLTPLNGTFERKSLRVPLYPDVIRLGRQIDSQTIPTAENGYFDSKVLSRKHAEVWADRSGKIWIKDKSTNGTFVNGQRLSDENKDSDPHEIREQDVLDLGIDIVGEDQKSIIHPKVASRVEFEESNVADCA
jgi:pSer/pThr/pTyr-binding forkhead associated (FHA) protein